MTTTNGSDRGIAKIERALISVSDKAGVIELGEALAERGIEILSTGGTATKLRGAGLAVVQVSDYTAFPECFDGRVKTLHPKIAGGILYDRDNPEHVVQAKELGISPIDLVVGGLYPFEETRAKRTASEDAINKEIDIGGPSMIRAAAKNRKHVTVMVCPDDYHEVIAEIKLYGGTLRATRERLAHRVFELTSTYDESIADWLRESMATAPGHA